MARVRQVRRCRARRTDGEPCKAYAITGGYVCRAHGGAARQVRHEARIRWVEARLRLAYDRAYHRWRREAEDWQIRRILTVADWLGISPDKVTPGDMLVGVIEGMVPGEDTAPKIRVDRRYGPRAPRPRARSPVTGQSTKTRGRS